MTLTFGLSTSKPCLCKDRLSCLYNWTLWDHSFLSYAADSQTNKQTDRQTEANMLPTYGVCNNNGYWLFVLFRATSKWIKIIMLLIMKSKRDYCCVVYWTYYRHRRLVCCNYELYCEYEYCNTTDSVTVQTPSHRVAIQHGRQLQLLTRCLPV